MKVTIYTIGKLKSLEARTLIEKYRQRISHYLQFEIVVCQNESQVIPKLTAQKNLIVLDEHGKSMNSLEFAKFIGERQMRGTKEMSFFIGAEDGIGPKIRERAEMFLSLSPMTYPHEMAQVILVEQVYRAMTILKGEPYHLGHPK